MNDISWLQIISNFINFVMLQNQWYFSYFTYYNVVFVFHIICLCKNRLCVTNGASAGTANAKSRDNTTLRVI